MKEQEQDALALSLEQHLEVSVLSGDERQQPEGKLGAERKLHIKTPWCHGLSRWILSAFPFLAHLYRCHIVRYLD
jgi:hypothetical protein